MPEIRLNSLFSGAGVKRLSSVETDPGISNQHEFNGVTQLKKLLGVKKATFKADFIYLGKNEDDTVKASGKLTWYDARENHPTRSEFRFYFTSNDAIRNAHENDLLIVVKFAKGKKVLVIVAENGSTSEKQLIWLFRFGHEQFDQFHVADFETAKLSALDFASRTILDSLNIKLDFSEKISWLPDQTLDDFMRNMPSTHMVSDAVLHAFSSCIDPIHEPDIALMTLLENEELLFRFLEKKIIQKKLESGFDSVDDFIGYSLSVQNRRKSRAGFAFENHLETLFKMNNIRYDRNKITEGHSRPDFIFPGSKEYHDPAFNEMQLAMLGVKTTCKDRWRQILVEAQRIPVKHLATLEPAISKNQTDEMKSNSIILVIPEKIHETYSKDQHDLVLTIKSFIEIIKSKQK